MINNIIFRDDVVVRALQPVPLQSAVEGQKRTRTPQQVHNNHLDYSYIGHRSPLHSEIGGGLQ